MKLVGMSSTADVSRPRGARPAGARPGAARPGRPRKVPASVTGGERPYGHRADGRAGHQPGGGLAASAGAARRGAGHRPAGWAVPALPAAPGGADRPAGLARRAGAVLARAAGRARRLPGGGVRADIDATVEYPYPPERVWAALTSSEALAAWLMPNDFVAEVGHDFTLRTKPAPGFDGIVRCRVLELDPPARMVWSWAGGNIDTTV